MKRGAIAALILALCLGCDSGGGDGIVCPAIVEPAVRVAVVDSRTGASLADSAFGLLLAPGYADTLRICAWQDSTPIQLCGGWGRAGTYNVTVQRRGYRPWAAVNVKVPTTTCGIKPADLTAVLIPESSVPLRPLAWGSGGRQPN